MVDSVYWIWFQTLFGVGTRRAELFLNYFCDPLELYESIQRGTQGAGMLQEKERTAVRPSMEQAAEIKRRSQKRGCLIITPDHPDYPPLLQNIYSKPAVLYARGDLCCLRKGISLALVGTRKHSEYGRQAAALLAQGLARSGVTVVSGLAKGIDTICHQAALEAGGTSVGILGCGLDVDYPKGSLSVKQDLCKSGAVISEYPLGTQPLPHQFPLRNRIMSGVCNGVVVVEADEASGSLITAHHALEQGRDVFAVPGDIFSQKGRGTHGLIKDGCAKLVDCPEDILVEYGLAAVRQVSQSLPVTADSLLDGAASVEISQPAGHTKALPPEVSAEAETVYLFLKDGAAGVEAMSAKLQMELPMLQTALTELEIYGLIRGCPGRTFVRMDASPIGGGQ